MDVQNKPGTTRLQPMEPMPSTSAFDATLEANLDSINKMPLVKDIKPSDLPNFFAIHRYNLIFSLCVLIFAAFGSLYALFFSIPSKSRSSQPENVATMHKIIARMIEEDMGEGCDVPNIDPEYSQVKEFEEYSDHSCYGVDWITCSYELCTFNSEVIKYGKNIQCHFRDIMRVNDVTYNLSKPSIIDGNNPYMLFDHDFVLANCTSSMHRKWTGLMYGLRKLPRKLVPRQYQNYYAPNILIFILNSVSKNNFLRKGKHSLKYLKNQLGAVIFNKHNIVGDGFINTFIPLTTGMSPYEIPEFDTTSEYTPESELTPFIWKKLSNMGYKTAILEELPWWKKFQYGFTGFVNQTVDYSLSALFKYHYDNPSMSKDDIHCIGSKNVHNILMDYAEKFLTMDPERNEKKFAIVTSSERTSGDDGDLESIDDDLVEWMKSLRSSGVLRETVFILMGDQGLKTRKIRGIFEGRIEERLPFMSIVLPEKFQEKRPEALQILKENADMLTTPYDLFNTILDMVGLDKQFQLSKMEGSGLYRSLSLIRPIPKSRSCGEAGIEPRWCTCLKWVRSSNQAIRKIVSQALLDFVNNASSKKRPYCAVRKITSVDDVYERRIRNELLTFTEKQVSHRNVFNDKLPQTMLFFYAQITVSPGASIFKANISYYISRGTFLINPEDVTSESMGPTNTDCIPHALAFLSKYCYCHENQDREDSSTPGTNPWSGKNKGVQSRGKIVDVNA